MDLFCLIEIISLCILPNEIIQKSSPLNSESFSSTHSNHYKQNPLVIIGYKMTEPFTNDVRGGGVGQFLIKGRKVAWIWY